MTQKLTILFFPIVFILISCSRRSNNIDKADKVEVISYESEYECDSTKNNESFSTGPVNPKCIHDKIILEGDKIDEINSILFDNADNSGMCERNDCYEPRHSVIFYSKGERVAYVDICLRCRQSRGENIGCLTFERLDEIESYLKKIGITYGFKGNTH